LKQPRTGEIKDSEYKASRIPPDCRIKDNPPFQNFGLNMVTRWLASARQAGAWIVVRARNRPILVTAAFLPDVLQLS
jgi:hypothetical protein